MRYVYNSLVYLAAIHLWIAQFFSKKLKKFVSGRKTVFDVLQKNIKTNDRTIWFHCASLGEYEQGFPIMEASKKQFTEHKIIVSFFSPSGYEIKKNNSIADVVVYLPLDTPGNAKRFIQSAKPVLAIFVKYEFWPNYLFELERQNIPSVLVSGLFREKQIFFKSYGGYMRKALRTFDRIFVQNEISEKLLKQIQINTVSISGDTRFDRVSHQIEQDNSIQSIAEFKNESLCIVLGSTWPEDELVLLDYMNTASEGVKFIMAPHKIEALKIETFRNKLKNPSVLYSEKEGKNLSKYSVLIIDSIGLLTKIYSYADIAYVGGAMGNSGLHNILEPATFGVPIVIGENYKNFPEAIALRKLAGLFSVKNAEESSEILDKLVREEPFRNKTGMIAEHFVNSNTGATKKVMDYLSTLLPSK